VWADVAQRSFDLLHQFPDATVINLGGGFKVARLEGEKTADFSVIGPKIKSVYDQFIQSTGRQLERVEIEPGTYLVANTGAIVTRVEDIVDTGADGYQFIKCDTGMNDILRPTLY
jgi:diaminopimelate decarboxylase